MVDDRSDQPLDEPGLNKAHQSEAMKGIKWYVIHCYSQLRKQSAQNLEQRVETMGMKDGILFDVVIPTQEEIEVRDGKRRTVGRHIFPGYVLVGR